MKKWGLMLLALLLVFQMGGCGKTAEDTREEEDREPETVQTHPDREPPPRELEELELYGGILSLLDAYAENKYILFDSVQSDEPVDINAYEYYINSEQTGISGYNGLKIMRDLLKDMESVDPWIGTEYAPYPSREEVLDRFYVVKDVLLSETIVKYMNVNTENEQPDGYEVYFWSYDRSGRADSFRAESQSLSMLYYMNPRDITYFVCGNPGLYAFSYDEEGMLSRIDNLSMGNFDQIHIHYSEPGIISSLTGSSNTGDVNGSYIYDKEKRVRRIIFADDLEYSLEYAYDGEGRLTGTGYGGFEDSDWKMVYTYTYDEAGMLVQIDTPDGFVWQLTYDDEGKLIMAASVGENRKTDRIMTYGDYYGYDPE